MTRTKAAPRKGKGVLREPWPQDRATQLDALWSLGHLHHNGSPGLLLVKLLQGASGHLWRDRAWVASQSHVCREAEEQPPAASRLVRREERGPGAAGSQRPRPAVLGMHTPSLRAGLPRHGAWVGQAAGWPGSPGRRHLGQRWLTLPGSGRTAPSLVCVRAPARAVWTLGARRVHPALPHPGLTEPGGSALGPRWDRQAGPPGAPRARGQARGPRGCCS